MRPTPVPEIGAVVGEGERDAPRERLTADVLHRHVGAIAGAPVRSDGRREHREAGWRPQHRALTGPRTLALPKVRLKVLKGPDKGTTVTLEQDEILIGGADGAHLRLTDPTVSRNHCAIRMTTKGSRGVPGCGRSARTCPCGRSCRCC